MNEAIELLLASRGRPARLVEMMRSAVALAARPDLLRFRVRLDLDDPALHEYRAIALAQNPLVKFHIGAQRPVPRLQAELARLCETELMMFACSDDLLWRTEHWDCKVREAFARYRDGLLVAATNDLDGRTKCQHFFTTTHLLDVVGEDGWTELEHFGTDHWFEQVARQAGRMLYLEHVVAEHMHMKHRDAQGNAKAAPDDTYRAKRERSERGSMSDRDRARLAAGAPIMAEQAERVRACLRPLAA